MGDSMKKFSIFKKLGFDSSNQWVLYDESFQKFFSWFANNVTDDNILSDNEILQEQELKKNLKYLQGSDLEEQLDELNTKFPHFLEYTDNDVKRLEEEIAQLEQADHTYSELIKSMEKTKVRLSKETSDLELAINELENKEKISFKTCVDKANELEGLQKENKKMCAELNECFTRPQNPPLFMHQMPLDQYYLKYESFLQHLNLYLKSNFKYQDYFDNEEDSEYLLETTAELDDMKQRIFQYHENYVTSKAHGCGLQRMMDNLKCSDIYFTTITQLKKETHEMELLNKHNLEISFETHLNDLKVNLELFARQQIELILYENTKQKFERASQRLANVRGLSKIVSEALSNAEIIWILMQLDMERIKNKFDNTDQLTEESQKCSKRIEAMRQLQLLPSTSMSELLVQRISGILSRSGCGHKLSSIKACLYEYEKFCRMSNYVLKTIPSKKSYRQVIQLLSDMEAIEKTLSPYVYNSPVKRPIFERIEFLEAVFKHKRTEEKNEDLIKNLRTEFHENIVERMNSDRLWRHSQILWIWFLTEPEKVVHALEEVKRAAFGERSCFKKID